MKFENWLPLAEYARKYEISVSTLRRRIRSAHVPHRLEGGKYLLLDVAPTTEESEDFGAIAPELAQAQDQDMNQPADEPLISTATKLLNELKRAYSNILHEKEEQIIQLKEEVTDLKTLVKVLEEENERIKRRGRGRELT